MSDTISGVDVAAPGAGEPSVGFELPNILLTRPLPGKVATFQGHMVGIGAPKAAGATVQWTPSPEVVEQLLDRTRKYMLEEGHEGERHRLAYDFNFLLMCRGGVQFDLPVTDPPANREVLPEAGWSLYRTCTQTPEGQAVNLASQSLAEHLLRIDDVRKWQQAYDWIPGVLAQNRAYHEDAAAALLRRGVSRIRGLIGNNVMLRLMVTKALEWVSLPGIQSAESRKQKQRVLDKHERQQAASTAASPPAASAPAASIPAPGSAAGPAPATPATSPATSPAPAPPGATTSVNVARPGRRSPR